mgnify:CR=1 FL=1|jgi:hypothetical protein
MNKNTTCSQLKPFNASVDGFEKLFEESESNSVWAEPQLYLLPFCVPQDRTDERFRSIKISETVKVDDEIKRRTFMVNPHPELGLPGSFELEVMTGIYRLADLELTRNGVIDDFIDIGSFRSFLELINRKYSGKYVRMLREALKRLAGTICISEGFFYSKPRDLYVVESFTFITSLEIAGETDFSGRTFERTRIKLHEFIRGNLNSNFRTLIDFDYLHSLKTSIAKPISLHFAYRVFKNGNSEWVTDYDWLANRLAIKMHSQFKRAKEQLKPALTELQATGLLQKWEWVSNSRLRLVAGERLLKMHKKRVLARDAWLAHQEELTNKERLVPRTQKEAERLLDYDPLAPICTEYAVRGWKAIAHKARLKGLDEDSLRAEALKRGLTSTILNSR